MVVEKVDGGGKSCTWKQLMQVEKVDDGGKSR